jgi:hypothetical protein
MYRLAVGPTHPAIEWASGSLSQETKRPVREADHSPPSNAEFKDAWSYTSTVPSVLMEQYLVKQR